VLEAAVNGFADAIVTYNRKHLEAAAQRHGIRVATPSQLFLKGWVQ
jgi:predicted nucleic acid-binding protein